MLKPILYKSREDGQIESLGELHDLADGRRVLHFPLNWMTPSLEGLLGILNSLPNCAEIRVGGEIVSYNYFRDKIVNAAAAIYIVRDGPGEVFRRGFLDEDYFGT